MLSHFYGMFMITPEHCGRLFVWPQSFNFFPNPSLLITQITEVVSSFFSRFGTSQIAPKPVNIKTVSMFSCVCLLAILLIGMLRPAEKKEATPQPASPSRTLADTNP